MYANALGSAQFVVGGDAIEQPNPVHVIVVVGVGVIRIERVHVELDVGFRFGRCNQRLLKTFDLRLFPGLLAGFFGPVIGIIRDAHHQLLRWHQFQDRVNVPHEPILRGNGTWRRRAPVLVVVHQNNSIRGFADARVVVVPIGRR